MTTTLAGEVGRTGRMEDVAMVQALLANTEGSGGRPFWDRRIDGRPGAELATAIENVAKVAGVGLALDRAALAHDRVAMWFRPVGLSVLDDDGRPRSIEGQPGGVPAPLRQAVDQEMTGRAAVEATGRGGYRPRDALQGLRGELDGTLLARFAIDPASIRGDRRPVLAALALIDRIDRLSPAAHDELQQLFDIVAADDPGVAEVLRQKRDAASRGSNSQPEAVGDGPSPFEQAVGLLLRITARNYQSSHMAQLRALTRTPYDRLEVGLRFKDLVVNRGPWDVKREFPRWTRDLLEGVEYGSDLWGNLHYGYIGRAAGFTETELELGGHSQAFMETEAYLDDPKDQNAIALGYVLWREHRFPLPRGAVIDALRARKAELNTR